MRRRPGQSISSYQTIKFGSPKSQVPSSLSNLSTSGARRGALFTKRARSLRKATRPNRGPEGLGLRRRGRATVPQACEAPGGRSAPRRPSLAKAICLKPQVLTGFAPLTAPCARAQSRGRKNANCKHFLTDLCVLQALPRRAAVPPGFASCAKTASVSTQPSPSVWTSSPVLILHNCTTVPLPL